MNVSDEIVDFLVHHIPAQALASFKAFDEARRRVWTLVAQEKESGLLPLEKVELEDFLKLEHLIVLAKAKALAARAWLILSASNCGAKSDRGPAVVVSIA